MISAPPLIASSTTTPQVKLTWGLTSGEDLGIAELTWKYGSQYQVRFGADIGDNFGSYQPTMIEPATLFTNCMCWEMST